MWNNSVSLNGTKDTLKGLKANTSYVWKVASICRYPAIIISTYTLGTNFTTPVSLTEISVTSTSDYTEARAGDGFSASIYPNPATTSARLQVKRVIGTYSVIFTNLQGTILRKYENLADTYINLPLENISAGVYMVIVFDKAHTARLKLVKQ